MIPNCRIINVYLVKDHKHNAVVSLILRDIGMSTSESNSTPGPNPITEEVVPYMPITDPLQELHDARASLEYKSTFLEKLEKINGVLSVVKSASETLSDVSSQLPIS